MVSNEAPWKGLCDNTKLFSKGLKRHGGFLLRFWRWLMELILSGLELQPFHVCVHANLPVYAFVHRKQLGFSRKVLEMEGAERDLMNANWNAMIEVHGTNKIR